MARPLVCWYLDGTDPHHPDPVWYEEHGKAFCARCLRFHERQQAKRLHPAGKAVAPNLAPLDPRKCYSHNREDKFTCPECIGYSEEKAVYLND